MALSRFEACFDGLFATGWQARVGATAQGFVGMDGESERLICPVGQPFRHPRLFSLGFWHRV